MYIKLEPPLPVCEKEALTSRVTVGCLELPHEQLAIILVCIASHSQILYFFLRKKNKTHLLLWDLPHDKRPTGAYAYIQQFVGRVLTMFLTFKSQQTGILWHSCYSWSIWRFLYIQKFHTTELEKLMSLSLSLSILLSDSADMTTDFQKCNEKEMWYFS